MTINMDKQLAPGTFEWTVDYLVDRMDISLFEKNNNDEKGSDVYHPGLLLKAILFCYFR